MKETDLDKVKAMAKVFLEIEIGETEMTPAIVQHPFANSGFYPCRSDCGNLRVIDITTPQGFDEWKKIMRERIDGIKLRGICVTNEINRYNHKFTDLKILVR